MIHLLTSHISLLAQAAAPTGQSAMLSIIVFMVLAVCLTVIAILILIVRHMNRSRDLLHQERTQAIDSGIAWPESTESKAGERYRYHSFWIAFWLVVCASAVPFFCVSQYLDRAADFRLIAIGWIAAGVASIVSSIGAVHLIVKSRPAESH